MQINAARETSLRSCCSANCHKRAASCILARLDNGSDEPPESGTFRLLSPKCVIRRLRFDVAECASFTLLAD
jgi:hypothetical protein